MADAADTEEQRNLNIITRQLATCQSSNTPYVAAMRWLVDRYLAMKAATPDVSAIEAEVAELIDLRRQDQRAAQETVQAITLQYDASMALLAETRLKAEVAERVMHDLLRQVQELRQQRDTLMSASRANHETAEKLRDDFRLAMEALHVRAAYRECPHCKADIADDGDHAEGCRLKEIDDELKG